MAKIYKKTCLQCGFNRVQKSYTPAYCPMCEKYKGKKVLCKIEETQEKP